MPSKDLRSRSWWYTQCVPRCSLDPNHHSPQMSWYSCKNKTWDVATVAHVPKCGSCGKHFAFVPLWIPGLANYLVAKWGECSVCFISFQSHGPCVGSLCDTKIYQHRPLIAKTNFCVFNVEKKCPPNHSTHGTLQWHPAMAPRPLPQSRSSPSPRTTNHSTLRHPTMARSNGTTSTAPCNGTLVPRPIRQSGSSPSPPIGRKNPYSYRYLGKERLRGIWNQSTRKKPSKYNNQKRETVAPKPSKPRPVVEEMSCKRKDFKASFAKERSQIGVDSGDPWASGAWQIPF